VSNNTLTS
jgi:hypothetical protein